MLNTHGLTDTRGRCVVPAVLLTYVSGAHGGDVPALDISSFINLSGQQA